MLQLFHYTEMGLAANEIFQNISFIESQNTGFNRFRRCKIVYVPAVVIIHSDWFGSNEKYEYTTCDFACEFAIV